VVLKNLFITRHGLSLRKRGSYITIKGKGINEKIPLGAFSNVFILANITISTQTLKYLSENGKYIFILTTTGKVKSIILPEFLSSNTKIREKQYKKFESEMSKVYIAKELLRRKAKLSQSFLIKFRELRGESVNLSLYKGFLKDVSFLIDNSTNLNQLRGVDGFIMKNLFLEFSNSIKEFFAFKNRSYHPPTDEPNAVLSLVFSMFYSLLFPVVISHELDPYCGFFHIRRGKHATLVSDLMELARPELIFFTADILNRGFFSMSDFKRFKSGVYMRSNAVRVLCKLFMEKVAYSNIFYPVQLFIKEVLLR